jgi:hypothetical protein
MSRLSVSRETLSEIFEIEIEPYREESSFPVLRDHRKWTIDDSDVLRALREIRVSASLIALFLGHQPATVRRWMSVV